MYTSDSMVIWKTELNKVQIVVFSLRYNVLMLEIIITKKIVKCSLKKQKLKLWLTCFPSMGSMVKVMSTRQSHSEGAAKNPVSVTLWKDVYFSEDTYIKPHTQSHGACLTPPAACSQIMYQPVSQQSCEWESPSGKQIVFLFPAIP